MRRHSIICRLGLGDRGKVALVQEDALATRLDLVSSKGRLDYGLGNVLQELTELGIRPTERAVDLLVLAAAVYCADTRICRRTESQDGWTREIDLYLPVSDPGLWEGQDSLLKNILGFLTGDCWRMVFRSRSTSFTQTVSSVDQARASQRSCVCLFSGGLDSFIGAIDLLVTGEIPLFVSHYWDGITSHHQTLCFKQLQHRFKGLSSNQLVRARVGFPSDIIKGVADEDTQRSRSFLFFALGSLVASGSESDTVIHVPENGLISLNVPLDPLRLGSLSTRTTHPYFMARFDELLRNIGIRARLVNTYRHMTKGEMVSRCKDKAFLRASAKNTMSCSSPTKFRWKGLTNKHCGFCLPCLIRRAALLAGFDADDTPYHARHLSSQTLDSTKASGGDIRSFQLALARLQAHPRLAKAFIHKPGPLSDCPREIPHLERMYLAGMNEVGRLLRGVTTRPL